MRGVVMHTAGDVRVEEREDPKIIEPTDAIVKLTASCICGSDLWPYRGIEPADHTFMGHEYVGRGRRGWPRGEDRQARRLRRRLVRHLRQHLRNLPGRFPVQVRPRRVRLRAIGTQAERARIPHADGTLVATPGQPEPELIPALLAASDVLGTGWFAADAAQARPGKTVAVVGDGAVGLMAILAAKELGAERIIAMSRHPERQKLARYYGATDIVEECGDEGIAKIKELTGGYGAHSVIEAVGTQESFMQAIGATRGGGHLGYVGLNYDVKIPGIDLFFAGIHTLGGPAPVRRFLPDLIQLIWDHKIDPGKVFDLTLPLDQAPEGYKAMAERRATKVLLTL